MSKAPTTARVLSYLVRRGLDEFAFVRPMAIALELRCQDVSRALDALVAAGHVSRYELSDRPLAYAVTPAGIRAYAAT